ncbi:polyprotein [Plakobranchus ocellatus]|uniref:Polyprotein n=1 Tax=Plakobranchus ocellatus TaxID=259542 RepID=A0AAV4DTA6_9GAST|nr:polyprotein [Plakobranchus ocellatus]
MCCRKSKLRLPLKSIVEEYKCGKAKLMTMLEDSKVPAVRSIQPQLRTGRKWKGDKAINQAKERLKMKEARAPVFTSEGGTKSWCRGAAGMDTHRWMGVMTGSFQPISPNGTNILRSSKTQE